MSKLKKTESAFPRYRIFAQNLSDDQTDMFCSLLKIIIKPQIADFVQ